MTQLSIRSALETAVKSLPNVIPAATILSSTVGAASVFETSAPHGLATGVMATIEGHVNCVPAVSGSFQIVVISPTKFSLKHPITGSVMALSVGGTGGTISANLTQWDNRSFVPVNGTPYQRVNLLFGKPENPSFGGEHIREIGFMQITLYYPKDRGTAEISARTQVIRALFKRCATFVADGITVNIPHTPEIINGGPESESYSMIVRIEFWADVYSV